MDNLAACARAARGMGLSYGKYVALYGAKQTDLKPLEPVPVEDMRYCRECNKPFKPARKLMVYCSDDCRVHSNARRNRELKRKRRGGSPDDVLTCGWCKKEFSRSGADGGYKYCSTECAEAAKNQRQREYRAKRRANNGKA